MLVGKTITQLPSLTAVTSEVTIPVEVSSTTYSITVDALSKSKSFTNNSAIFYSNPKIITESFTVPSNSNALMIGPTVTLSGDGVNYILGDNSQLTVFP